MYAKCLLTSNSAGRLTRVRTALCSPEEQYTCHNYGSVLVLHAGSERPWFAHIDVVLTVQGQLFSPYIHPATAEVGFICKLRRYVPNARPVVSLYGHKYYADRENVCS